MLLRVWLVATFAQPLLICGLIFEDLTVLWQQEVGFSWGLCVRHPMSGVFNIWWKPQQSEVRQARHIRQELLPQLMFCLAGLLCAQPWPFDPVVSTSLPATSAHLARGLWTEEAEQRTGLLGGPDRAQRPRHWLIHAPLLAAGHAHACTLLTPHTHATFTQQFSSPWSRLEG